VGYTVSSRFKDSLFPDPVEYCISIAAMLASRALQERERLLGCSNVSWKPQHAKVFAD